MSYHRDQFFTYHASREARSAKVVSERPLVCHRPVIPG